MTLPSDVSTFTLKFGPYLDARGATGFAGLKGSIVPVDDANRPIRIVHPESNDMIVPLDVMFVLDDNGEATVDGLPFNDSSTLFPHPFRYRVTWGTSVRARSGRELTPGDKTIFIASTSGSEIFFNRLEPAIGVPGVYVFVHGLPTGGTSGQALVKHSGSNFDTEWVSVELAGAAEAARQYSIQRGNHTGTQPASTISDFTEAARAAVPLTDYITDDALAEALEALPKTDLSAYAKTADVATAISSIPQPDLTPYAKTADVTAAINAIPQPNLDAYVTDDQLAAALSGIPQPDLTPYATKAQLTGYTSDNELAAALEALNPRFITTAERTKLAGIATGATANATDAQLRDRATHTGTQTTASIADLREYIEDTVGGMLRAVGADLDISYDDQAGTLTVDYTGVSTDPEAIRDTIGAAMVGLGNITVLVNDAADTITITTAATVNSTDAALRDRATHTGTQSADTIVDGTANKVLTADDQILLRQNSPEALGWHLVRRDGTAQAKFGTPTDPAHASPKSYTDSGDSASRDRANHTGTQPATTITGLATVARTGYFSDLQQIPDFSSDVAATPSVLMRRGPEGRTEVADPTGALDATNKRYVDARTIPSSITTRTAAYTAAVGQLVLADCTTAAFTVTLPAAPATGAMVTVKKIDSSTNALTIAPAAGGSIDGDANASAVVKSAGAIFIHTGNNAWQITAVTS